MRIPFPSPLTVGTDIIMLNRIWRNDKPNPASFTKLARRVLQPLELADFTARHPEWQDLAAHEITPHSAHLRCRAFVGGRWAAKEAAMKAWGADFLGFRDLRVEVEEGGGNVCVVCSPGELEGGEYVEQVARLSISHEGQYAVATVLASPLDGRIMAELERRKGRAEERVNGGKV